VFSAITALTAFPQAPLESSAAPVQVLLFRIPEDRKTLFWAFLGRFVSGASTLALARVLAFAAIVASLASALAFTRILAFAGVLALVGVSKSTD
jgi:hypothetical protein